MRLTRQVWNISASLDAHEMTAGDVQAVQSLIEECGDDRRRIIQEQLETAAMAIERPTSCHQAALSLVYALRNLGVYLKARER